MSVRLPGARACLLQVRRGGRSNETDSLSRAAKDGDASVFHKDSSWVRVMTRGGKQRGEGKEADGDDGPSEAAASGWARLLGDRPILEVHSHAHQPHLLMTVHGPKADLPAASSKAAKAGSSKKVRTMSHGTERGRAGKAVRG